MTPIREAGAKSRMRPDANSWRRELCKSSNNRILVAVILINFADLHDSSNPHICITIYVVQFYFCHPKIFK